MVAAVAFVPDTVPDIVLEDGGRWHRDRRAKLAAAGRLDLIGE